MKKVLSLVLVIAMVLSSMSFAFAGTFEDVTGDYEDAINTLTGLGVVTGYEDGTYRPEKVVTRAEMAKLMVEILGYGDLVAGAKSNFADTQGHWADAYIALAAGRNIVVGDGNGNFRPDATVTYNEVLTMIVRGLGYTDDSNEIKSMAWPTNFKVKAAELGITDGVKMSTTGADRGGVAQALYNALDATLVSVNTDGDVTYLKDSANENKALLTRIANKVGTVDSPYVVTTNKLDPNHKDYAGNVVDLLPYLYQDLQVYVDKNDTDTVVYIAKSYSEAVEGTLKKNDTTGKVNVKLADESTEVLDIDSSVSVYYNGKQVTLSETVIENGDSTTVNLKDASVVVVLDSDDDVYAIVATKATYGDKIAREYKEDSIKIGQILLPLKNDEVDLSKVTVTGEVDDIYDIEEDDVVIAYAAEGKDNDQAPAKVKLVVVRDTVEGKITEMNSDGTKVYIDGTGYSVSKVDGVNSFAVANEGTFFLDDAGKVFEKEASTASDAKDYAVVIQVYPGSKDAYGRATADPEVKLINAAGEVVTYEVSTDAVYQGTTKDILNTDLTFATYADVVEPASKSLIKYKLDSDGLISKIAVVDVDATDNTTTNASADTLDTTKASFDVAENAPIFNIDTAATGFNSTKKDFYSVVDADNLPDDLVVTYADLNDDGQLKVLVSTNAKATSDKFALITSVGSILNDDDEIVAKVTAYVDGEEVVYQAVDNTITIASSVVDNGNIVKLSFDGDEIKTSVATTESAIYAGYFIETATSSRVQVKANESATGEWVALNADEVVVYVLNSDNEFESVGSVDDLAGYDIVGLFNTLTDANNAGYEIIVVK